MAEPGNPAETPRATEETEHQVASNESMRADIAVALRRLEQEVAERTRAEGLLRAVVDGTSDTVFVKDREGRYRLINAAGARFLGTAPETLIGHDDRAFLPPAEAKVSSK